MEHPAFHVLQFLLFTPWCLRVVLGLPMGKKVVLAWFSLSGICLGLLSYVPQQPRLALGTAFLVSLAAVAGEGSRPGTRVFSALCLGGSSLWLYESLGELPFFVSYSAMLWTLFALAVIRAFGEGRLKAYSFRGKALWGVGVMSALCVVVLSWLPSALPGVAIFLGVSFLSLGAFLRETL